MQTLVDKILLEAAEAEEMDTTELLHQIEKEVDGENDTVVFNPEGA